MSLSHHLTTIAALPGSGAGCAAALKAEVMEHRKPASRSLVNVIVDCKGIPADVQKLIAQQIAESMRRKLLSIAGAA